MNRSLRPYTLMALAALIVGVVENLLFGSETPGVKHQIAVGFFFLCVAAALALAVIAILAVTRRLRPTDSTRRGSGL